MKNFKTFMAESYEYHSLHFDVTGPIAERIIDFGKRIPDELLIRPGREKDPHITCKFGINEHISKRLMDIVNNFGPVKVSLGLVNRFQNEVGDVLKIDVHGGDIKRLNNLVVKNIKCIDKFPTYVPHLTIAHMKRDSAEPYLNDKRFIGTELSFDSIIFATKDEIKITISLT
jgi:2'-5' RNA ligase